MQEQDNKRTGFEKTTKRKTDPAAKVKPHHDRHLDKELDEGIEETFPASDPVSIMPGAD